ncbi:uncharacterized protein LOC141801080 isoform X2 [Halichoeres trimaculatus]|uniref:uncharacterized protein LOC141801080 isoform X2 n=1 Tax=Halichoeres trimaculatus TaxID=147232 RepID=UPI003D9DE84F
MVPGMHVPLLVFLSTAVLRCASAGGAYCAKTARARAAALGLDYPGTHGAPDLSGPPHNGMYPHTIPQSYLYNDGGIVESDPNVASYRQNQPGFGPIDDRMYRQSHPMRFEPTLLPSRDIYNPEYNPNQGPSFPRARHNKPPQSVQNGHDLVGDESVPNRRGMSLSGPPLPQSRGRATYQRGYGPGRGVPVLGSAGLANKEHGREMNVSRLKKTRIPGRVSQPLHRRINPKQLKRGTHP